MTDLEALAKVYRMAYHANDLKGRPWTDEEEEALAAVANYIERQRPTEVDLNSYAGDPRTPEQRKPGPDYVPIGGAGNDRG